MAAGLIAFVGAGLVARWGPLDRPGARSAHRLPTPTSGGLAVIVATAAGCALQGGPSTEGAGLEGVTVALAAASLLGAIGAIDDRWGLGARLRLAIGAAIAIAVALATPPVARLPLGAGWALPLAPLMATLGAALWLVTVANAVNFVDGANALAPGAMTIAFLVLAFGATAVGDAPVATAAGVACAALVGLLAWNARGRVFQGDAGALFCGLLFASLDLAASTRSSGARLPIYFGPVALAPILAEVLLTLLHRARRGRPLLEAHREHLYQRWLAATGKPHLALAWRGAVAMLAAGAAALAMQRALPAAQPAIFAAVFMATSAGWAIAGRRLSTLKPRD